jgi:hypothetical protein
LEAQGSSRRHVLKTAALATVGGLAGVETINAVSPMVLPARQGFDANLSHWSAALPQANPGSAFFGKRPERRAAIAKIARRAR